MASTVSGVNPLRAKLLGATASLLCWVLASGSASARDLFAVVVTVGAETAAQSTNSFLDVGDFFAESNLLEHFPTGYDPGTTGYSATLDFRGMIAAVSFDENSETFRFRVPALAIDLAFTGASRDLSVEEFEDWLKGKPVEATNSEALSTQLMRALVAQSPVDPVAGNPNSLESRMFERDLDLGTLGPFLKDFSGDPERPPSLWKLDFDFGHFAAGPYGGQTYELDIAFGGNVNRRIALMADLGMMFSVTEGQALTGLGNLGLGLQGRIAENWNLALVVRGGVVGSIDVGGVGAMVSVSLVNHMGFDFSDYRLEMSNMVGSAVSIDGIEIDGVGLEYDNLTNVVLKNGFSLYRELARLGGSRPLRARLFVTDTQFFGDDLWLEHSDEVGLGLGLASANGVQTYDPVALDLSYVFGTAYDAFRLKLSLRF